MTSILTLLGDCSAHLANIVDGSVKCVVTSPPYNIGKKYNTYSDKRADYNHWLTTVFAEIERVLQSDGSFFLQVGGTPSNPALPHEILQLAYFAGFEVQNEIIWAKSLTVEDVSHGHFKPINSGRYLNSTHEFIFHLTKTGKTPINRLAIGVPYKDSSNVKRWKHGKTVRCGGSVWYVPYETVKDAAGKHRHPAGFPVDLPLRCILLADVKPGETVLDPFMGTGSTLVAAQRLGVNGIGIELDPTYTATAKQRLGVL